MPTTNVGPGSAQELQHIADIMGKSKKVVVITGAGISTNCGIPDFRSENGLYSLIQAQYDAALKDPSAYTEEIDDRPTKRRRVTDRWTYVTVKADTGEVVTDPSLVLPPPGASSGSSSRSSRSQSRDPKSSEETTPVTSNSSESEGTQKSSQTTRRSLRTQLSQEVSSDESVLTKTSSLRKNLPSNPRRRSERQTSCTRIGSPPPPPTPISSQNSITSATQSSEQDPVGERIADNTKPKTDESAIGLKLATGKSTNSSFEHSEFIKAEDKSPLNDPSPTYTAEKTQTQREESIILNTQETETSFQASQSSQSSRTSLPNLKGKDLFDAMVWQDSFTTSVFYRFISSLRKKVYEDVTTTTESHKFIRTLYNGGRLVRTYTQNIDGLEEREGLCTDLEMGAGDRARFTSKRDQRTDGGQTGVNGEVGNSRRGDRLGGCQVVQLHGSLDVLRCGICQKTATWDLPERQSITLAGQAPDCPICEEQNVRRTGRGRRSLAVGRLRPDIVLYGEEHPSAHLIGPIVTHDLGLGPDVLLIMGTSLRVHGLKVMVKEFAKAVHSKGGKVIFVNNTKPSESIWGDVIDFWIQWDCDSWVLDLKQRRKDLWLSPGELAEQKTKRQSTSERQNAAAKPTDTKRPYRPSATRDCKLNGAYITSKILQMLGSILGPDGRPAPRIEKLNSKLTVSITTQSKPKPEKRKSVAHTSSSSSARKICKGKTRSSLPSRVGHESRPTIVTEIISKLRRNSDSGMFSKELLAREALASLSTNAGRPVATSYKDFHFTMQTNLLQGLTWPLKRMNLMTLPPNTTGTRMKSSVDIRGYKNDTYSSFSPVTKMAASRGTTEVAHSSREDNKLRLASLKSIGINTIQAPASAEIKMGACDDVRACDREFRHQTPVRESKAALLAPPDCNSTNNENPSEDPTGNEDNLHLPRPRPNTRSRTSDATQLQDAVDAQLLLEAMAPKQRRPSGSSTSLPKGAACIDCRQKKRRCLHVPSLPTPPASSDDCILANSDPLTPSTQRIKNMGKIGAVLSSPARSLRSRRTGELRSGIE